MANPDPDESPPQPILRTLNAAFSYLLNPATVTAGAGEAADAAVLPGSAAAEGEPAAGPASEGAAPGKSAARECEYDEHARGSRAEGHRDHYPRPWIVRVRLPLSLLATWHTELRV